MVVHIAIVFDNNRSRHQHLAISTAVKVVATIETLDEKKAVNPEANFCRQGEEAYCSSRLGGRKLS
jgi:hypothetical protein